MVFLWNMFAVIGMITSLFVFICIVVIVARCAMKDTVPKRKDHLDKSQRERDWDAIQTASMQEGIPEHQVNKRRE